MSYTISILRRAQKELEDLPADAYERVKKDIYTLAEDPRPPGCLKLTSREAWRIRISHYRVIYEINDEQKIITILHIGHRRDVYR
ncbi:type II toxin-antitoxin system RelE/ParE family toxin [Nostoc sp. UHCC 0702]|nr:type II toxin-antitoxin system RelE/ParE family toxin [Nostoc sp. UHCC 0702]